MPRYADIVAVRDALYEADAITMKGVRILNQFPTISPDDVRGVGEWEDAKQHGLCRCSVCKDCYIEKDYITQAKWKYCPSCGARMEVSEDTRKN